MTKSRHQVLGMLFLLSVVTYLDRVCISAAAPLMRQELGISLEQMSWVFGLFALSYGLFEVPSGWMGDRFGPRVTLMRIVVWWSVFTAWTGAVRSYSSLLVCRFLFGAGEAGAYPNSSCTISRWFPFRERARAHGVVWMASRIGGAISPLVVVPLQQAFGWRAVFWIFGALGLVWAAVWYAWFRDYPHLKSGVSRAELAEIGEASGPGHVSLPWKRVALSGNLWAIMIMYHTYCYGAYWFLTWMPTYLAEAKGIKAFAAYAALPFILGAIANAAGGVASDALVKRIGLLWGRRTIGLIGLGGAGVLMLVSLGIENKTLAIVVLSAGFAASDFMLPNCWAVCLDVGKRYAGTVSGSMNMAGQMGSFIASTAFGYLVQRWGWTWPMVWLGSMSLISALFWFKIDATQLLVPEPEPEPAIAHR